MGSTTGRAAPLHINDLLRSPRYRIATARTIAAPRQRVWNELLSIRMSSLPRGFALTLLRHAPGVMFAGERRVRGSDTFLEATPIPVLAQEAPRRVISAGPSQAWKVLGGSSPPVRGARTFSSWSEPGWITVAMQFELEELPDGRGTLLSTETRIGIGDSRTAAAFGFYWWAIRAASASVRREVVDTVRLRGEARVAAG
jgi:hypothetical protein